MAMMMMQRLRFNGLLVLLLICFIPKATRGNRDSSFGGSDCSKKFTSSFEFKGGGPPRRGQSRCERRSGVVFGGGGGDRGIRWR
ncbi:hypothetical protein MLD38_019074 [Melastoma candidum]|uniref:Uncharacterized protein n=1 Tax=Melastoma candidum TaxID=119954 RepID=A0ACB9QVU7_9MYRT|nr:hypothetical protein MLD38_019074 [Melastoma candidum]